MLKMIASGFMWLGFAAAFVATAAYVYWMWTQDWGPMMTRGHNLMLVLMLFGAVAVFLIVLLVFGMIAVTINKDLGK